jgi:ceramide glucosyltransferase
MWQLIDEYGANGGSRGMTWVVYLLQGIVVLPTVIGSAYSVISLFAVLWFCRARVPSTVARSVFQPPVTVLKPVYGLEKDLKTNLRSICLQDYPIYQVVLCFQRPDDPALPLAWEIRQEFGANRISVVVSQIQAGPNGKVNNLLGGLTEARHEILVMSDSDVLVRPDYLQTIVAPLADWKVGGVCTLFKVTKAQRWYEKLELLSINADFIPNVIFAHLTGTSKFCLGPSIALRRSTLKDIGGLESLADFLVEDYELGRRIWTSGQLLAFLPYFVDVAVDLQHFRQWWDHQCYWDQNTWAARPWGFLATVITRAVPFALLFAAIRLGDAIGLTVLGTVLALRLATIGGLLQWGLLDREGIRSLLLLPLRDLLGLASWAQVYTRRTVVWRGQEFVLTRHGRLRPYAGKPVAPL